MIFGVIGAGQMGAGIAQVAAQAGFEVLVQDMATEFLARGENTTRKSLARLHGKGRLDGTPAEVLERIRFTTELQDLAHCDLVVEAIVENEAVKAELFRTLGAIVKPSGILAKAESQSELEAVFTQDPFVLEGCSEYSYVAFTPVKRGKGIEIDGVDLVE